MLGWFRKKPRLTLATASEREAVLAGQDQAFREVDGAFHAYLEVIAAHPRWNDDQVEGELIRRGVAAGLAEECVSFGPLAWGREVVEQFGVTCSPRFRLHSMTDGSERDLPLAEEPVYAWARALIGLYRSAERNEIFKRVAGRSAEVGAVDNALNAGVSEGDLRSGQLEPSLVHFRRSRVPDRASGA